MIDSEVPHSFLRHWTNLERIVSEREDPVWALEDEDGNEELHLLLSLWARVAAEKRRRIEYFSNIASLPLRFKRRVRAFAGFIDHSSGLRESSKVVDVTVVLRVWMEDEEDVKEEIAGLEDWVKPLIRLELVER